MKMSFDDNVLKYGLLNENAYLHQFNSFEYYNNAKLAPLMFSFNRNVLFMLQRYQYGLKTLKKIRGNIMQPYYITPRAGFCKKKVNNNVCVIGGNKIMKHLVILFNVGFTKGFSS